MAISTHEKMADALLAILEQHNNELFIEKLKGDLKDFIATKKLSKNTRRILDTFLDAAKPALALSTY